MIMAIKLLKTISDNICNVLYKKKTSRNQKHLNQNNGEKNQIQSTDMRLKFLPIIKPLTKQ